MFVIPLVAAVALAASWIVYVRAKALAAEVAALDAQLQPSTRRIAVVALGIASGPTLALSLRGLYPPAALVIGMVLGAGVFVASVGALGLEGVLLQRASDAGPPPSSRRGRIVAVAIGLVFVIATGGATVVALVR